MIHSNRLRSSLPAFIRSCPDFSAYGAFNISTESKQVSPTPLRRVTTWGSSMRDVYLADSAEREKKQETDEPPLFPECSKVRLDQLSKLMFPKYLASEQQLDQLGQLATYMKSIEQEPAPNKAADYLTSLLYLYDHPGTIQKEVMTTDMEHHDLTLANLFVSEKKAILALKTARYPRYLVQLSHPIEHAFNGAVLKPWYQSVPDTVAQITTRLATHPSDLPLEIIGHSQGAVQAQYIATLLLQSNLSNPIQVKAFAPPLAIGSQSATEVIQETLEDRLHIIYSQDDPISKMVPKALYDLERPYFMKEHRHHHLYDGAGKAQIAVLSEDEGIQVASDHSLNSYPWISSGSAACDSRIGSIPWSEHTRYQLARLLYMSA